MKIRNFARPFAALALAALVSVGTLADTIHMKDGQVIRGQIVSFRDQQFTVLIGAGARGRRSRVTVYMEDVDFIEFDSAGNADTASNAGDSGGPAETSRTQTPAPRQSEPQSDSRQTARPPVFNNGDTGSPATSNGGRNAGGSVTSPATNTTQTTANGAGNSPFFPVRVRVYADNRANGWTDSGLMVRKGQRLRVTATGRVSLGNGNFSTPTGLPRLVDTEKLMRNEPTGELIAVIGDDNDEFIPIGAAREFYAPRDGRLFLGVNEGNLADNTGSYDALIEVEPVTSGGN